MLIGYARVSTGDQSLTLQIDAEKRKLAVKLYNDKNYSVNQICQVMEFQNRHFTSICGFRDGR